MMSLNEALLTLKTPQDMGNFLRDLCTPGELKDFSERWTIAQLLDGGDLSYRDIAQKTGASITTVTRVARFLKDEPYQGYRLVLARIKKTAGKIHHRLAR